MSVTMGRWVEINLEDARWAEPGLKALAKRALKATMAELGLGKHGISLLGCDDARIALLNTQFRAKAGATNVLSWPTVDLSPAKDGDAPAAPKANAALGDVAIAFETCLCEADQQGKSLQDHVTHLIVHATLHLIGYDHVRKRDAARMEALETKVLASLGISDPYHDLVA
jgi:probable rRNA maturation factor